VTPVEAAPAGAPAAPRATAVSVALAPPEQAAKQTPVKGPAAFKALAAPEQAAEQTPVREQAALKALAAPEQAALKALAAPEQAATTPSTRRWMYRTLRSRATARPTRLAA
jgi:hypothetical protein